MDVVMNRGTATMSMEEGAAQPHGTAQHIAILHMLRVNRSMDLLQCGAVGICVIDTHNMTEYNCFYARFITDLMLSFCSIALEWSFSWAKISLNVCLFVYDASHMRVQCTCVMKDVCDRHSTFAHLGWWKQITKYWHMFWLLRLI